jgi:uncharacterized sulfatase
MHHKPSVAVIAQRVCVWVPLLAFALVLTGGAEAPGNPPRPNIIKTNLYEGGIRSPLIVWAPGLMAQEAVGSRNRSSVFAAIDLVPSLLEVAGAEKPAGVSYDGEPLPDTLLGKSQESRQAPVFFSRPPDRKSFYGYENLPDLAVRHGKWKLLCDYNGSRRLLYDLDHDPGEQVNVAGKYPAVAGELSAKVLAWWREVSGGLAQPTSE